MPSDRLPAPPPVPRDELPTVPPPRDPELDALAAELDALRADARRLCRGPSCECCGAPAEEPCDELCGDADAFELF